MGTDWSLRSMGVTVRLGDADVVSDASFDLVPGTVTAIVGPNGSGKSTLLRALCRLLVHRSGTVSLTDVPDTRALSAREFATRVGLLSQQRPTPAGITVRDIVEFGRHPHRTGWRGVDPGGVAATERALELTGLTELADSALETLSGGQLQRAWFAGALAQDTGVLFLDEPTNHLDLRYQVDVLDLIAELAGVHGVTVGVVLHDLNHAADIADRVLVLNGGRIVADGPPPEALDAELLSAVYGIAITVTQDPDTEDLDIRARRSVARRRSPDRANRADSAGTSGFA